MNGKHLGNWAKCEVSVKALLDDGKRKSNAIGGGRSRRHNSGRTIIIIIIKETE